MSSPDSNLRLLLLKHSTKEKVIDFFLQLAVAVAVRVCVQSPIMWSQIPASTNMIGWNKYKAKDSETPRSPGFQLVCHYIHLKSWFVRLSL